MSRFLNARFADLEAYTPGEQPRILNLIKLNTNESPFPPSPQVLAAANAGQAAALRLYPDPECTVLREKLAVRYEVEKENIFLSNGSDDILNFAFMAFSGNGVEAVFPEISYGFYPVFTALHGISWRGIPLREDFSVNPADYYDTGCFTVIANPNAPTGMVLSPGEVEEILRRNPDRVVLIDEAYVDFGAESCVPLTKKYDNLLVVMTFSKSRSLAGARIGFAIGNPELIQDLNKIKYSTNPYSINRLSLAIGEAAMDSRDYYEEKCREIARVREETAARLKEMGFTVLPSKANFLFTRKEGFDGGELYRKLKERGILVRHFTAEKIAQYNRVTVGTAEEMEKFLQTVEEILKGGDRQ